MIKLSASNWLMFMQGWWWQKLPGHRQTGKTLGNRLPSMILAGECRSKYISSDYIISLWKSKREKRENQKGFARTLWKQWTWNLYQILMSMLYVHPLEESFADEWLECAFLLFYTLDCKPISNRLVIFFIGSIFRVSRFASSNGHY